MSFTVPTYDFSFLFGCLNCLEAVNSFVSVSMVKMCQNPYHLTN